MGAVSAYDFSATDKGQGVAKRTINGFVERIERIPAEPNPHNVLPQSVDGTLVSHPSRDQKTASS